MNSKPVKLIAFLVVAALMLVLPLVLQATGSNSWVRIVDVALLYVLLALGLNIVVGYAGLLDLGFIAFFAVGAYLYGLLASPHLTDTFAWLAATFPNGLHMNFWLVMVLAGIIAGVTGLILGFPVLKLRGDYLAIVTLGFGEIVRIFMLNLDRPINLTNGPKGLTNVDAVSVFGHRMSQRLEIGIGDFSYTFESVTMYYYLILFFVVVAIVIAYRLQDSRIGRAWMAIREDEIAAKAMGLNTRNLKLAAFGMSATFGGIAGVLFASFMRGVYPESFILMESVMIVAMVVLGGLGHIPGVILGALVLAGLPELLRHVAHPLTAMTDGRLGPEILRQLLIALAMIVIMLLRPKGLWPSPEHGKSLSK
ncbi:MAG: ABC transporter ATP-binding protein [Hydrogenophaga sp.]|uniref:branched-chain amino acid ABC transporter permease n=1 Tax=Hydrogenophaga sp. TaxID=1904254 RepID=UPI0016930596|nr:ABC transporter ATP-binding protein [Hydrogenophaga sp.]NIM42298.1 ABC transporter ATP-binding protein [Hydrogenophaga sp.]NIN28030.1 ABC transporter ATP-binding protein [Hydrogenophaga sp.]NIN32808.1 ABC transporter ATP-binding protein [Hydrogenophaga sp.]NIN54697.1 ABC transporter ATP-binding protein [Hydrogenophaga sp.]NIO51373.1 ABC transporter ATP-binding protein [Hydrogenophaga sp.]